MDTLFRLVSLQQYHHHHHQEEEELQEFQQSDHSFNSASLTTSTSSHSHSNSAPPPPQQYHHHPNSFYQTHQSDVAQECFNIFMDEDDFSSSSSKHTPNPNPTNYYPTPTPTPDFYPPPPPPAQHLAPQQEFDFTRPWASDVLLEAARAAAQHDTTRLQHLMWILNELASPYGDADQKLASYFLQALFARMTESGPRSLRSLSAASDRSCSFDSTRKLLLRFQDASPWTTFGHVAANGAILEALDGNPRIHIVDLSSTFCTQWPTLLESLATRSDDAPHLRLTTVLGGASSSSRVMKEIGGRMEKFARLMGVPFKFNVVHHSGDMSALDFDGLGVEDGEALAINCVGSLHSVSPAASRREYVVSRFRQLRPRVVTVVEEEADLDAGDFVRGFEECLRWFRVYFECLEESFPKTSNERLMLERGAGRAILDLVACPAAESTERRETAERWSGRLRGSGFCPVGFSEEVSDDVKALLRRYKEGWSMRQNGGGGEGAGMFLCWKEQPVVWASAWRPIDD
ncbi:unnamed protein product [Linum tenue]|uniref:Uncharacterized protein n=2 Tax=Linum tenue TaxID=586396 RepID=A0AAV0L8I4_9ROSI|nr:unnamed protein product [Linum tenue]